MKKLRVNKKYGEWYYEKEFEPDMRFPIYCVTNKEKTECYRLGFYQDVLSLVKEPTKELRKEYERIYG